MGRVVVVGSFNVDHVWRSDHIPVAGQTLAGRYDSGPGGKGFNQAMAARRAGADTVFLCALGEDSGGQLARALCTADGIDLRDATSSQPTGTAGIFVDAEGRNCIVIGPGANGDLHAAHVAAHARVFETASVVLAQLESPVAAIEAALRRGREAGATTLLNPAPANAEAPAPLLALADVITPNESEFAALLARHTAMSVDAAEVARTGDDALHALCRLLHPAGTVLITLGEAGCFVSHAEQAARGDANVCYRVAAEAANVVDTTGAGDAFNGALAASLAALEDANFHVHVAFANSYAARSTERRGAALAMPCVKPLPPA